MPFSHDRPSLEHSPETHDREAVGLGSTEDDVSALRSIAARHRAPEGPWLDIACGSGRHVRALAATGIDICGIDIDPRMIAAAQAADPDHPQRYHLGDAARGVLGPAGPQSLALVCLLNRSLVCFHSHRLAWGLFSTVARHLRPGGLWVIDNCCTLLWDQVKDGLLSDGLSPDNQEQIFFLPGENRFVYRRGPAVDADSWQVKDDDRIMRLWSIGEVVLAASGVGLAPCQTDPEATFLIFSKPLAAA